MTAIGSRRDEAATPGTALMPRTPVRLYPKAPRLGDDAGMLRGWDAIARFWGCSPNTAQRMHRRDGMPVTKIGGQATTTATALWLWATAQALRVDLAVMVEAGKVAVAGGAVAMRQYLANAA